MYKDCEIGSIPTNWNIQKLEELANVTGGKRLPKGSSLSEINNGHPYIRVSDMNDKGIQLDSMLYVPDDVVEQISRYRVDKDDLYISVAGTLGLVGKVPDELNGANLTENADRISNIRCNTDFLLYCLKSDFIKKIINSEMTTNAQPKLALTRIKQFPIPVPPLKEQQKIAEILSSVDAAIEKTEQVIAKTEEVKKGLMQQLLTKGIGHTEFKQTEIGEIPVEWEVKKLVNFSKINSENLTSSTQPEYEFNYIDIATITDTGIIGETTKYSFCDAPSRARRVVRNKDIIVSTVRPYLKSFAFITEEQDGYIASTGFAIIRVNEDVDSNYIYQHILSERFIEYCKSKMTGSNYPAISANDVKEYSIGIPPLKEQKKISSILNEYDKKLQCEKDKIIKLKSIKQGLMQQLLTGQARVKVD